jgi:Skp family chaperone for outer membrane proteins
MKKILITMLTVAALSATSMAFAADAPVAGSKDECLLASKNCMNEVDSIQQRMKKINSEIKKGKKVYSAEELKKLEQKLKEADEILKSLEKPGK